MMISFLLFSLPFGSSIDAEVNRFFEKNNTYSAEILTEEPPILTPEKAMEPALAPMPPLDYVEGGIRAANGKRIIDSLSKIAAGSKAEVHEARGESKDKSAFAYLIAMDSISSLTSMVSDQIQTWANQFNTMALLSEIVEGGAEGVFAKSQRLEALADERRQAKEADRFEARALALENLKEEGRSRNIAWEALRELSDETRNLFLTLTGGVVVHSGGVELYPSLFKQAIAKLLDGSASFGYKATEEGMKEAPLQCNTKGERAKVMGMLRDIQAKLREGSASFSEEEKTLIHSSRLPLGSLITLMTQYKGSAGSLWIERFGHLIAMERVTQFVDEALQDALNRARAYTAVHPIGGVYLHLVEEVISEVKAARAELGRQVQAEISALELMLQLERSSKEETSL